MLCDFLLLLFFCHSLFVPIAAIPQVTPFGNSTSPVAPESGSKSESSSKALGTGLAGTETTPSASICPSSCSFDGPLITGYNWVPVVANQTVTATIILIVAPVTANASGPYANQPKYQVVDTQTEYNSLPPEVTIPLVGADGSALASVLTTGADGSPSGTYIAYPTNVLDYQSSFDYSGPLPTPGSGRSACAWGGPHTETLPSHPIYAAASALPTNVDSTNYELVPAQFVDVAFLRSAFPDETAFQKCSAPIAAANQTAITRPVWVTVTTTANQTLRGGSPGTNAPIIEQTVPSGSDEGGGNFTPFVAHTEETVPATTDRTRLSKARTEQSVGAQTSPTAMPESSGGGGSGGGSNAQPVGSNGGGSSGGSGNSGSGIGGAIASALGGHAPSPGSGAGSSGPQATPGAGSTSSGSSGQSGGQSSSGQGGSSSGGSGQSGSSGASGSNSGSGESGSNAGGSTGGNTSEGSSGQGGSGQSGSNVGGSVGGGMAGVVGSGSSSGGSTGGNSASGGSSGGGSSGASGSNIGAQPGSIPASITVGATTLSVTQTVVPITSNVGGSPVTSNVPAVVIGGSTATLGGTLTVGGTPIAFTAAPTAGAGSSSSSSGGTGSSSSSGSGSGSGSSGSGSSSGSNGSGSGGQLIIGGTSTVPLGPLATGSPSGAEPAPVTIGSQIVAPTELPGGSGIGFIVGSQTLAPGHPITLGSGSQTTVVSLTTNSAGETLLVQGTSTQTLEPGLPPITLGSQIIQPTELPSGGEGFVISGQTLAPGHAITLGTGSHTTVLSLTTDSAGDTLLVEGTSTITLVDATGTSSVSGAITSGISGSSGGSGNGGVEQSNDSPRLEANGNGFFGPVCMAMVMGIAGTSFIL